ncbi:iron chelate uptake ABC transporter family permease subunit [Aeromicrobium sp. 50.2.37]|uniref:FecCD family ABC transporter permease n=1 Tax=Aeromicrobium sp. 50.2.37 TaxID=2969305 RepID=UPI00214FDB9A|nr:iron ABC transporter permease [Aeromicrobium sp. 50.2.37]MCR4512782.1 iron ABC transporter permease [Aeromicrobium sp. 50.2.37]
MSTATTPLRHAVRAQRRGHRARTTAITAGLAALAFALFVATMMIGTFRLSAWEVVGSVFRLTDDPSVDFIVLDLRLPTAATAVGVGLALGVAGLVFQRLLANPLASPDFVGISGGASLFAVSTILFSTWGAVATSGMALLGAVLAAVAVYLLAWRDGITGYRFILIGIGLSELFVALTGYVIAKAELSDAREAMTWLVGSVGSAGPFELRALLIGVAVLLPVVLVLSRRLGALELGDDAASALGVDVERSRLVLLALSVVLVALATAAAGPVAFVALISGPIAIRLVGNAASLPAAAFVGAVIVLLADLVAQHALPVALPTGVITGAVGAPYLIWLLATVNREGRGG